MYDINPAVGKPGRLVATRIMPGMDLITGIEEACKAHGITHGTIICTIGSLACAALNFVSHANVRTDGGHGHTTLLELNEPLGLLGGNGVVSVGESGELDVHYHATISGKDDKVYGGHMLRGRCKVLSTTDVIIQEMVGIRVKRSKDPVTGITFTSFESS